MPENQPQRFWTEISKIGARIRLERRAQGISQAKLAKMVDSTTYKVQNIELCNSVLRDAGLALRIADLLGIEIEINVFVRKTPPKEPVYA
jgi:transcriptional regulator with XRE-family HTH domain